MFERYSDVPHEINDLGGLVIGVAIGVQRDMGRGLLERPYKLALAQRLANLGHHVRLDVGVSMDLEGFPRERAYALDMLVDDVLVVEVKSTAAILSRHVMQTKTYLQIGKFPLGYVLNFGPPRLGIRRVVP